MYTLRCLLCQDRVMNNSDKHSLRKKALEMLKKTESVYVDDIDIGDAALVLAYIPLKSECDISPFIEKCIKNGRCVAVPTSDYKVFAVLDVDWKGKLYRLENGTYSVESREHINIEKIDKKTVILVPGLLFTLDGRRLGRGHGFYDRVLACVDGNNLVRTIGICKKNQLVEDLPTEYNDKKVCELSIH